MELEDKMFQTADHRAHSKFCCSKIRQLTSEKKPEKGIFE